MAYTHYWRRKNAEIPDVLWEAFADDCRKIIERHKDILCYEYDSPNDPPLVAPDQIRFNGIEGDGHETFYFERYFEPRPWESRDVAHTFRFCKTARKPYDEVVVAVLSCAKKRFGSKIIEISSDGGDEAFPAFKDLVNVYDLKRTNPKLEPA